jgi:hypothetical protein
MLSSPWSLGFVLAVVVGAMLVPGCAVQGTPSSPGHSTNRQLPSVISAQAGRAAPFRATGVAGSFETRPVSPPPAESVDLRQS